LADVRPSVGKQLPARRRAEITACFSLVRRVASVELAIDYWQESAVGLGDIAGVFSRFFIVGFFLPAFFALIALSQLATEELLPDGFEHYGDGVQVLILGGTALVAGLFLLGLHYNVIRLFEGYPLMRPGLGFLARPLIWLQTRSYEKLCRRKAGATPRAEKETKRRGLEAWRTLDRFFPSEASRLLPTRFGNAMRAAEDYSYIRWKLDAIPFWARVEPLLSDQEVQLHESAKSDVAFFLNSALGAAGVGTVLVADEIAHGPVGAAYGALYAIPFALAYVVYRFSINAAWRWGVEMRASIDLHRLEVYERLGVRRPKSFRDERTLARRLNRFFLYATELGDDLWAEEESDQVSASTRDSAPQPSFRRVWIFGFGSKSKRREEVNE
jgi:hypothetical protein